MRSKADKTQKQFGLQTASMSFVSLYFERERNSKEVIYLLARFLTFAGLTINMQPFYSEDVISNSPYCRPCNSCVVSLKNLVLDQLNNSLIGFFSLFSILIACVLEMALILFREILSCHFFMSAKIIPEFLAHYASTQSSPVQFWHTSPVWRISQSQTKPNGISILHKVMHLPPFWHGDDEHPALCGNDKWRC